MTCFQFTGRGHQILKPPVLKKVHDAMPLTRLSGPLEQKPAHSTTDPRLYLTMGMRRFSTYLVFHQTQLECLLSKCLLSDLNTLRVKIPSKVSVSPHIFLWLWRFGDPQDATFCSNSEL
ncbi:hypothetical protein XENOCAPTIV_002124 [Xenoophorus captivus]|uniref:Uncharacterized protein n=1 Tax=Xenoophorus captivus TaxID=1517983 RepID=A0ABV0QPE7_9TELE